MGTRATVIDNAGEAGRLVTESQAAERAGTLTVALEDGRQVVVPNERLLSADDGSYRLDGRFDEFDMLEATDGGESNGDQSLRVPLAREEVSVERRRRQIGKVRIHKRVETDEITLTEPLTVDETEIERVPINRVVDQAPEVHRDGDAIVIPVVEERLVKQLVLVEEIRVRQARLTREVSEPVTLRRERVDIEHDRLDSDEESGEHRPSR